MTGQEVLVTTPSFGQQSVRPWEALEREGLVARRPRGAHPLAAADLLEEIGDAPAVIVGLDAVDATVLERAPGLRVVAKHGVGVDNVDLVAAARAGVTVVNAPGSNSGAVADLALGAMLALARRLVPAHASLTSGRWERFPGVELEGRTVALVGFGRIGRQVARRAAGFGTHVVAYDPYLPDEAFAEAGVRRVELDECVAVADFLSLHLPADPADGPVLDRARLATMREGAYLVNAARGGLVDEDALVDLLEAGHLAGAALDAFAEEPPRPGSRVLTAPNVLLTPHIGAHSDLANAAMGTTVVADVARVLRGEDPLHPVAAG